MSVILNNTKAQHVSDPVIATSKSALFVGAGIKPMPTRFLVVFCFPFTQFFG